MKTKLFIPILILISYFLYLNSLHAQTNRRDTKKSIAYKSNYQRIASSNAAFHTLEIREGTLWACGDNSSGQLGDGTNINKSSPVQIGTDNNWVTIAAGEFHSLGLKSNGSLWAWGRNFEGQLGTGDTINRNTPIQIGMDNNWICIVLGCYHSLGLKSDGTIWAWGGNNKGQIGDGSIINQNSPVQIGMDNKWVSITAGDYHSFGLKSDGTLWAWGYNLRGQLGDGTIIDRHNLVQIGADNKWVCIAAGTQSIGLKSDGTLWAWGWNMYGQLGDGTYTDRNSPVQIGTETKWVSIATGVIHTLGLKADGTLWAWGSGSALGDGTTVTKNSPVQIGTDNKWVSIAAGFDYSLGLKSDGTLWAWGWNSSGQLGDGTTIDRHSPIQTSVTLHVWLCVAAGGGSTFGVKSDGTLWAWGYNSYGELGDGTTIQRTSPIQIGTDNKWVRISTGFGQTNGLKSDGTLWAWGDNGDGQLGDGTTSDRHSPVQIGTDTKWVNIAPGRSHTLSLKSDGTLWAWGNNSFGQLGGTFGNHTSPVQIGMDNHWVSFGAGHEHSLGLKSDGTLWAWGWNVEGELGDGTTTTRLDPVQIGTDTKWVSIAAGDSHSLGLKSDGTLWAWGWNGQGTLGDGTTVNRTIPMQIGTDNKWLSISAGWGNNIGLKSDGTLWAWGGNFNGELGDGTTTQRNSPVQIGGDNNWINISEGGRHSLGLKSDRNQFCATGDNTNGELGDGTIINKNTFTCSTNCSPIAPTSSNKIICNGISTLLSASGIGILGWYTSPIGGTYLGGGTNFITPSLTTDTTFFVQDSTCGASATRTSVSITINNLNPPSPLASNITICGGSVASLSATGTGTLGWYTAPTGGGYLGGGSNYLTSILTSDTTFYVQDSTCAPSLTRTQVNVTINNLKPPSPTASNSIICTGNTASLSAIGIGTLGWYSDATVGNYLGGGANYSPPPLTTNTTYYVQDSTCSASSMRTAVLVTVDNWKPPAPTVTNSTICSGSIESISATGTGTLGWYTASTDGIYLGGGVNYTTPILTTNTTYFVQDSTCAASSIRTPVLVIVNSLPSVLANASATSVCTGTTVILTGGGATTYSWTGGVTDGISFVPSSSTTYTVTGTDSNNCSNAATITVTISPWPDVSTNLNGLTISANQNGAAYQWLDCNNGLSPISGATNQSYTATLNSEYAVIVSMNGCSDTSACVNFNITGINEIVNNNDQLSIFPNPGNASLTIQSTRNGVYTIMNESGQQIQLFELNSGNKFSINIEDLSNGIYFIVGYDNNNQMMRQKVVVAK